MRGRKRLRLAGYDYSAHGAYLVTTCVAGRRHAFGAVVDSSVRLSPLGALVTACLEEIEAHHPLVRLDEHVVMPDHVHAIVLLPPRCRGETCLAPTPLGVVVGGLESAVVRRAGEVDLWQRGYHDRVIRNEHELAALREYVAANPRRWSSSPLGRELSPEA